MAKSIERALIGAGVISLWREGKRQVQKKKSRIAALEECRLVFGRKKKFALEP